MTKEELLSRVEIYNPHYIVISNFISLKKSITVQCKHCGTETHYNSCSGIAYRTVNCPECERRKKELLLIDYLQIHRPWIQYISGYINRKTNCIFKCLKCGNIFLALPNNLMKKVKGRQGCKRCLQVGGKSLEEFEYELSLINSDIKILSKYRGFFELIECLCKLCNYIWLGTPDHLLRTTKCPKCLRVKSKGELELINILFNNKITFISLYPLQIGNSKLYIDIYIPSKNLFIEYNGQLHYFPVSFGEKDLSAVLKKFQKLVERDNKLRLYCLDHNIQLLEIKYDVTDIHSLLMLNKVI